jgi:hypothetical protein
MSVRLCVGAFGFRAGCQVAIALIQDSPSMPKNRAPFHKGVIILWVPRIKVA